MRHSLDKTYQVTVNPLSPVITAETLRAYGCQVHLSGRLLKSAVQILSSQDLSPFVAVVSVSEFQGD